MKLKRAISLGLFLILLFGLFSGVNLSQDEANEEPQTQATEEAATDTPKSPFPPPVQAVPGTGSTTGLPFPPAEDNAQVTDEAEPTAETPEATSAETTTEMPETTQSVSVPEGAGIILSSNQPTTTTASATPPPLPANTSTYTVVRGDTLFRIAQRFGTTTSVLASLNGITNPSLIYAGQVLRIPAAGTPAPSATPTTPPSRPPQGDAYVVQRGDTLYRIAVRNNTTVSALVAANNITNPNVIFVGQRLVIPGATTTAQQPTAQPSSTQQPEGNSGRVEDADFAYGVEIFMFGQDVNALVDLVETLDVDWVKVRVDWRMLEPEEGEITLNELTNIVTVLDNAEVNILLSVTNAPAWARTSSDENGPPDNLATFTNFMSVLANEYAGVVDAYQIWDEPNLRRNWNCNRQLCDTDYLEMLRVAYTAVKAADSSAQVITAGLAPTGFNDRVNAINDVVYLQTLFANGVAEISDGIGAHPGGWANPPDATCCDQPEGVDSHYESSKFYFLENLREYRNIMVNYGDADTPIWITKFGWGTSEDTSTPNEINAFVTYTSLAEQAIYVPRAFEIGQELGYVGPMILDNLNGCQGFTIRPEACYSSLIGPDGEPRLVFEAVANIDKASSEDE